MLLIDISGRFRSEVVWFFMLLLASEVTASFFPGFALLAPGSVYNILHYDTAVPLSAAGRSCACG